MEETDGFASDDPLVVCQTYLRYRGVKGKVIFAMLTGSQAYNLVTPTSDKDYLGIYLADTREMLEIDSEIRLPSQPLSTLPTETTLPDVWLYEGKQFLKLLAKGNPFMLETLYTQRHFVSTPSFDALRANRRVVLTNALVEEFLSYVRGQIVVHQRKGLKGKRLYHILRLLFELERIVAGNEPLIFIPDGNERDRLMALRSIENPGPETVEAAEAIMRDIEKERPWKALADAHECELALDSWLVAQRLELLK